MAGEHAAERFHRLLPRSRPAERDRVHVPVAGALGLQTRRRFQFDDGLRERSEDIALLVWAFVRELEPTMGKRIESTPRRALDALVAYSWPATCASSGTWSSAR